MTDAISALARRLIKEFQIRCAGPHATMRSLSGGNQQKLVLGREIARNPKLLIAMQPTRGLDVGAIDYVHLRLIEVRNAGTAVLLISTEIRGIDGVERSNCCAARRPHRRNTFALRGDGRWHRSLDAWFVTGRAELCSIAAVHSGSSFRSQLVTSHARPAGTTPRGRNHVKIHRAHSLARRPGYVDAIRTGDQGQRRFDRLSRRCHRRSSLPSSSASAGGVRRHAARHGGAGARSA